MELPLQHDKVAIIEAQHGVSILVLMELPLQQIDGIREYIHEYHVSILVLMELPLQHSVIFLIVSSIICFNPCFNGTTSAT